MDVFRLPVQAAAPVQRGLRLSSSNRSLQPHHFHGRFAGGASHLGGDGTLRVLWVLQFVCLNFARVTRWLFD